MGDVRVKICGLRTAGDVAAVAAAGAAYAGFNFFPKSPRYVTVEEARALALGVGQRFQHSVDMALGARPALNGEAPGLVQHHEMGILEECDRLQELRVLGRG